MKQSLSKIDQCFFINLDRRQDRLDHINQNLSFLAKRFAAIDSNTLELDFAIESLFKTSLTKLTKAEIACALSHYSLWNKLSEDNSSRNFLILEDDSVFHESFTAFWDEVYSYYMPDDYYLIYLGGCQPWNQPHYNEVLVAHNEYFFNVKRNDFFTKDDYFWHMNANSYILSREGADLLLQKTSETGIDCALDNYMQRVFNQHNPNKVFHLNPLASFQLHEEGGNCEIDKNSDLRFSKEKF